MDAKNIITDPSVTAFMKKAQQQVPSKQTVTNALANRDIETLIDCFDFKPILTAWDHLKLIIVKLLPNEHLLSEKLDTTQLLLAKKIANVAEQFIRKERSQLTDKARLEKASGYFLPQLTLLHENILELHLLCTGSPFEPDYFPTLNLLLEQVDTKIAVFKLLPTFKNSDEIQATIKTIATSYKLLDSWKVKPVKDELVIENPALYAKLVEWRQQTAELKKTLSYHVLSDQVMADISAKLPRSLTQLSKIKNVGDGKTMQHGEEILKSIREYLGEGNLFG